MHRHWAECSFFNINWQSIRIQDRIYSSIYVKVTGWKHRSHFKTPESVTNFIQLVSPQLVDWFHKPSCAGKPQMRAICIYIGYTKVITSNQDIRPLVTVKVLLAIISGITKQIFTIKVMLESTHQMVSDNILYII